MRRTREAIGLGLALSFAAACLAMLAAPLLAGKVYLNDDLGHFHYPLRDFYSRALAGGDASLWFPNFFCGFYLHGEGQAGMGHPWHLLIYSILSTARAFNVEILANYPWAFAGTYFLLRRRGLGRDSAGLGALMFAFAGFNLFHYMHVNAVSVVAQVPWLLLAQDVAIRDERPRARALGRLAVGLLTASQLLMGYPQYVLYSLLAEGFFLLALAREPGFGRMRMVGWVAAKAMGALGGSYQLLPTFHLLAHSSRSGIKSDPGFGSLHPFNLVQIVAPYLYKARVVAPKFWVNGISFPVLGPAEILLDWRAHEFGLYNGAIVPALAIWLGLRRRELGRFGPPALAAGLLAVLALAMSLGDYTPLFRVYSAVPMAGNFRIPARHVVLYHLATAILAAIALADLGRFAASRRSIGWGRLAWLGLPLTLALVFTIGPDLLGPTWPEALREPPRSSPAARLDGLILIGAAGLLTALGGRGVRLAPLGLLILAGVDQTYSMAGYLRHTESVVEAPAPGPNQEARVAVIRKEVPPNLMAVAGHRLIDGYTGLGPRRRLDYDAEATWRASAVRVTFDSSRPPADAWQFIPRPIPRARLVSHVVLAADPPAGFTPAEANAALAAIDQTTTAILHHAPLPALDPAGPLGTATIARDRPGSIEIETDAPAPRLLVLSESHYPGWRVEVDGRPVDLLRVDYDFQGCPVGPGKHRVAFRFDPESARDGLRLSALGLALVLATFAWSLARPRPHPTRSARPKR